MNKTGQYIFMTNIYSRYNKDNIILHLYTDNKQNLQNDSKLRILYKPMILITKVS